MTRHEDEDRPRGPGDRVRRELARLELDRAGIRRLRDSIARFSAVAPDREVVARSYPGYPWLSLPRVHARPGPSLEDVLQTRRSRRPLSGPALPVAELARLLGLSHGVRAAHARGPVPSAGGLQALELYPVVLAPGAVEAGAYHYDRERHGLARLDQDDPPGDWRERVPSLRDAGEPPLLAIVVGDAIRVEERYGLRGARFLLLEAGHLAQNLCLVAEGMGLSAIPLGGVREDLVARSLRLPATDAVLYAVAIGRPGGSR